MDDDGFSLHRPKRRGTNREPAPDRGREEFRRNVQRYEGTSEDFDRVHARRYAKEEGLGPDGRHRHGQTHFPRGSERERLHTLYSASTKGKNTKRDAYLTEEKRAKSEFVAMEDEEQEYYTENSGGFTPRQHERLEPRARDWRDTSLK